MRIGICDLITVSRRYLRFRICTGRQRDIPFFANRRCKRRRRRRCIFKQEASRLSSLVDSCITTCTAAYESYLEAYRKRSSVTVNNDHGVGGIDKSRKAGIGIVIDHSGQCCWDISYRINCRDRVTISHYIVTSRDQNVPRLTFDQSAGQVNGSCC